MKSYYKSLIQNEIKGENSGTGFCKYQHPGGSR
jgi:hypothetical protein